MDWRRLERRLERYAIPNLSVFLAVIHAVTFVLAQTHPDVVERMLMFPPAVLAGEWWRPITFLFVCEQGQTFLIIIYLMALANFGQALEQTIGSLRFNLYILVGWMISVAVAFFTPGIPASNAFLLTSVFLAWAVIHPDEIVRLYFVVPITAKWIALIQLTIYGALVATGTPAVQLQILAALGNFLLFFAGAAFRWVRSFVRRTIRQSRLNREETIGRHRCEECGITQAAEPTMMFRYCSKCRPARCFCERHLPLHEHRGNA
jgi:hypothetical protein